MTCEQCGTDVGPNEPFCRNCGAPTALAGSATAAMQAGPTPPPPPPPPPAGGDTVPSQPPLPETGSEITEEAEVPDELLIRVRAAFSNIYDVEKELGRGGMAIVYKGMERDLHRTVAIKVLPPEMAGTGDTAERFKREARLAAALDHPHIMPVYRVGHQDGLHFMAMKFVEGRALDEIVGEQGALPIPAVVKILRDTADALAFAHDNEIIHRDIKGGNILIDTTGRVLVADFGIARAMGEAKSLTATGMVVGTPNYMSPEQCGGLVLGPQSDQYSLAIMAFQLLTGSLPFEADSVMGIIQHHYMTPPPDIRLAREDVPEALLGVIYKALAKKPEGRFATTRDMMLALDAVPLSEDDRRDADRVIRELSTGKSIPKVATKDLPSFETPIGGTNMAEAATVKLDQQKAKRSPALAIAATVVIVTAAGAGVAWQQGLLGGSTATGPTTPAPVAAVNPDTIPVMLTFSDLPSGARITVDGQPFPASGNGPVLPGLHSYVVTHPQYRRYENNVTATAGNDITIPLGTALERIQTTTSRPSEPQPAATGTLTVAVRPPLATITVNGTSFQNRSPTEVRAGTVTIRAQLEGYVTKDTTVTVDPNENERVTLTLVPSG